MASYDPPYIYSNIFNDSYFTDLDGNLTLADADKRYLKLSGGIVYGLSTFTNGLNVNVLSASSRIETNNNSNTLITNSSFCDTYGLHLHSVLASSNGMYSGSSIAFNNSSSDNVPLSSINLDKIGSGNGNLVFGTRNGATCDERVRITSNGLNVSGNYYLNNVLVDFSVIQGITLGSAANNKVLTLDNSGSISTITSLTSTTYYGTTANIQFMNCDILSAAINCNAPTFYAGGTAFINSTRDMSNINTLTFAGTKAIRDVSTIDFNLNSLLYKTVMRKSTLSGSSGIEFYSTEFSTPSHKPMINFQTGNDSEPIFLQMQGYLNDGSIAANGWPAQLRWIGGQGLLAGINLTVSNTSNTGAGVANNVVLSTRNATIPHVVCNDQKNQLHLWPQGLAELNTSYAQNVIVGEELLVRKSLQIGTSQDTARLISALDSTMVGGDSRYITLGRDNSSKNQAEISFYYDSGNSNANRLDFGFYGGALMYLTAQGRLGVGTSSPRAPLEVSATTGQINIIPIGTITYGYNVSNGNWTNYGGGPITIPTLSGIFNGNIYVSQNVFTTSDRRLKENIKEIDLDIERYKKLKPVSYNYKSDDRQQLGFIAQDTLKVCSEAITFTENANMKVEEEGDLEGIQLGMDYKTITVLNTNIIQKLIERVELLEAKLLEKNI